jgi:hypothetical protein
MFSSHVEAMVKNSKSFEQVAEVTAGSGGRQQRRF